MVTHAVAPVIRSIPADQIDPNPWNPNRMEADRFAEYVAEVRRLRRLPKPVVVRKLDDRYQIVDGEHGWRAAVEVGFAGVLCEVVEVDEFAARLETLKRNQHGEHNRVLDGRNFIEMMALRGLNNCELADEIHISEGTVRNALDYAEAADRRQQYLQTKDGVRNCCELTGDAAQARNSYELSGADAEIAKLSVRRVALYLGLPRPLGDKWLDAGGFDDLFNSFPKVRPLDLAERLRPIVDHGLANLVSNKIFEFRSSLDYVLEVATWLDNHLNLIAAVQYAHALADHGLPAGLLDYLPCRRTDEGIEVLVTPEEWQEILDDAAAHAGDDAEVSAAIEIGLRVAIKRNGADLAKVFGPQVAELQLALEDAPEFIRDAEHLTFAEQVAVHRFRSEDPSELAMEAKQMAVDELRQRRESPVNNAEDDDVPGLDISTLLARCLDELEYQRAAAKCVLLPNERETLRDFVLNYIGRDRTIEGTRVKGRPVRDVLMDEAASLSTPMLAYLKSMILSP